MKISGAGALDIPERALRLLARILVHPLEPVAIAGPVGALRP